MGYTHYWRIPQVIDKATFAKIVADAKKIYDKLPAHSNNAGGYSAKDPLKLAREYDDVKTPPVFSDEEIWFNGVGEHGHETFAFTRESDKDYSTPDENGLVFNFCKTARKPYDLMVCCVLLVAKKHLKARIKVSSDGDVDEWEHATALFKEVLGTKAPNLFRKEKRTEDN